MKRFLVVLIGLCISIAIIWTFVLDVGVRYPSTGGATVFEWLSMRIQEDSFPEIDPAEVQSITQPADLALIHTRANKPRATWIGHATMLVQYKGVNFLTDPHFTDYPAPLDFVAAPRLVPPALDFKQLPKIDFIVISHNHYDHLDHRSVDMFGNSVTWYVPLGLKQWFLDRGIKDEKVIELEWWQSAQYNDHVSLTFTPSVHWSKRSPWDTNKSHWGGWSITIDDFNSWFAGDTAYDKVVFEEIGKRAGPFDMAFIPIGAYSPRYFMSRQHVDPAQAVSIHQDIISKHSIAMHWGTFQLTSEPYLEPVQLLKKALKKQQLTADDFTAINIGESISY